MYKKLILVTLLHSALAYAENEGEGCLFVQSDQEKLTFIYDNQTEQDRPYFYVKVLMNDEVDNKVPSVADIQAIHTHLSYIPYTEPQKYQIPANAKKLYIVKSADKLDDFDVAARIAPTLKNTEITIANKRGGRNANNYPRHLPRETKLPSVPRICEFELKQLVPTSQ